MAALTVAGEMFSLSAPGRPISRTLGEASQGDELLSRDVFAAGEGGAGDGRNQLAKGPLGLHGARLQPAVGQGL